MVELRGYQREAVDAIYDYFSRKDGNPLIVMPTGSGKSHVIAAFLQETFRAWPDQRVVVLTHVKELIQQDHDKILRHWPGAGARIGVNSAGLGARDLMHPIIVAGIQSVWRNPKALGRFNLVLVDEAHLLPKKGHGMYRSFLTVQREINPELRVVGFTATPFRTDTGRLNRGPDRIFTDVAYTTDVNRLIAEGWLATPVTVGTDASIDTRGVRIRQGEFVAPDLEAAAMRGNVVSLACCEAAVRGEGRRRWLVFCCGIEHAERVRTKLCEIGVQARAVYGETSRRERDETIGAFRRGEFRALVNVGVLTHGFDVPEVDLLMILRPTQSPGLWVQMVGRGMRTAPGKTDCLVLDFGRNGERHGPINAVKPRCLGASEPVPAEPDVTDEREVAGKYCKECHLLVEKDATECPNCGYVWPEPQLHDDRPSDAPVLAPSRVDGATRVDSVRYRRHAKRGKPDSMRVDYQCGLRVFSEWVCIEHGGYATQKAVAWWNYRAKTAAPTPLTVDEMLRRAPDELRRPEAIRVTDDDGHERVSGHVWPRATTAHDAPAEAARA